MNIKHLSLIRPIALLLVALTVAFATGAPAGAAVNHPPVGSLTGLARTSPTSGHVTGVATDPDVPNLPIAVEVWVGNRLAATGTANAGADRHHYDLTFPADAREHQVCVIGIGRGTPTQRVQLGCAGLGAAAPAPTTPPSPAPAPAPTPQQPSLPCRANVTLFIPVSMEIARPPAGTCFKWVRTSQKQGGVVGFAETYQTSANWTNAAHQRLVPWTYEDINSSSSPAQIRADVARINAGKGVTQPGFVQYAIRTANPTPLDQLGIAPRVDYIPAIQVYGTGATGPISNTGPLAFARSQLSKGALPIFRITPSNLTPSAIQTIGKECVNFRGRIGIWTGSGAYPDPATPGFTAAVEAMTVKVRALYRAIDVCNQTIGAKSGPSAGL